GLLEKPARKLVDWGPQRSPVRPLRVEALDKCHPIRLEEERLYCEVRAGPSKEGKHGPQDDLFHHERGSAPGQREKQAPEVSLVEVSIDWSGLVGQFLVHLPIVRAGIAND